MLIHGSCHCGNLSFALLWEPTPEEVPARACDCSFCSRHAAVWTAHPEAALRIVVEHARQLSRYRFGTRTAEFWVCAGCGVVPVATSEIEDRTYAVVNVNTFADLDASRLRRVPVSFDAEGEERRLARRKRNWIAAVECVERSD